MLDARRALVLGLSLVVGCDDGAKARSEQGRTSSLETSSAPTSAPAPTTSATATAAPASSANANAKRAIGTWSGNYEARRGKVTPPPGSAWPAWKKDGGKRLGPGAIELTIDQGGDVRGTLGGALGTLVLRGRFDEDVLRAGFQATDQEAESAMSGVLTGTLRDGVFKAELRASDEQGDTVRAADVTLRRREER